MTPPSARGRVWCAACRRSGPWFAVWLDTATIELAAAHARHQLACPAARAATRPAGRTRPTPDPAGPALF